MIITMQKTEIVKETHKRPRRKRINDFRDLEAIAIAARREKAEKMLYDGKVSRIVPDTELYYVESETKKDTRYLVKCFNINSWCCDCVDFSQQILINKNHKCKHIYLVQLAEERSFVKRVMKDNNEYDF